MARNDLINKVLLIQLKTYFAAHPQQYDELRQIINQSMHKKRSSLPSLRGLEYVTTYMSKRDHKVGFYFVTKKGERRYFHPYNSYKTTLADYKKRCFDSFKRAEEIRFTIPGKELEPIITTVGQLQWSRWLFQSKLMEYAKKNWPMIRDAMALTLKEQRATSKLERVKKPKYAHNPHSVRCDPIVLKWS